MAACDWLSVWMARIVGENKRLLDENDAGKAHTPKVRTYYEFPSFRTIAHAGLSSGTSLGVRSVHTRFFAAVPYGCGSPM